VLLFPHSYYWVSAPRLLKTWGIVFVLGTIPFQQYLLPRSVELLSSGKDAYVRVVESCQKVEEARELHSNNVKHIEKIINNKTTRNVDVVFDDINDVISSIKLNESMLNDSKVECDSAIEFASSLNSSILNSNDEIRYNIFVFSMLSGILAIIGMIWENHRLTVKEMKVEE